MANIAVRAPAGQQLCGQPDVHHYGRRDTRGGCLPTAGHPRAPQGHVPTGALLALHGAMFLVL